jgi:hypothetical protein
MEHKVCVLLSMNTASKSKLQLTSVRFVGNPGDDIAKSPHMARIAGNRKACWTELLKMTCYTFTSDFGRV